MMRIKQAPSIDVHLVDSKEVPGGIGDTGTVMAFPSLANAIFAITGVRLRKDSIDRSALAQGADALKTVVAGGSGQDLAAADAEGV